MGHKGKGAQNQTQTQGQVTKGRKGKWHQCNGTQRSQRHRGVKLHKEKGAQDSHTGKVVQGQRGLAVNRHIEGGTYKVTKAKEQNGKDTQEKGAQGQRSTIVKCRWHISKGAQEQKDTRVKRYKGEHARGKRAERYTDNGYKCEEAEKM